MKEEEARKNKYRCPNCNTPLNESRGNYYCPSLYCKDSMYFNMKGKYNDNRTNR